MFACRKSRLDKRTACWYPRNKIACSRHGTRRAMRANSNFSAMRRLLSCVAVEGFFPFLRLRLFWDQRFFSASARIILYDSVGAGGDGGVGAVILFKLDDI